MRNPKSPLMRIILRTPALLYRTPLRVLLGRLYVLLVHRGRKTRRIYRTCVNIFHKDRDTGEIFVLSAWGSRSDWYRNIQESPPLEVRVGSMTLDPRPRFVEATEARPLYVEYVRDHPIASRFGFFIMGVPLPKEEDEVARISQDMPVVAFRPT
jgi:deazaflavin-dependent oxidoreductase (nitroreductase family)